MKRILSILALTAVFGIALPSTADAAPDRKGKSKGKSSQVSKKGDRDRSSSMASRGSRGSSRSYGRSGGSSYRSSPGIVTARSRGYHSAPRHAVRYAPVHRHYHGRSPLLFQILRRL